MLQKIMIVLVTLFPIGLLDLAANEGAGIQSTSKEHNLKVSLTTGGGPFGPVKSKYRRQEGMTRWSQANINSPLRDLWRVVMAKDCNLRKLVLRLHHKIDERKASTDFAEWPGCNQNGRQ